MSPLYDEDTETMYLIGRGDATIRSMQISDLITRPTIDENMACGTMTSVYGATLVRKQSLHVMQAEIARVLAVVENAIMPVSFEVPRKVRKKKNGRITCPYPPSKYYYFF